MQQQARKKQKETQPPTQALSLLDTHLLVVVVSKCFELLYVRAISGLTLLDSSAIARIYDVLHSQPIDPAPSRSGFGTNR
jgi:hypothetical protein